MAKLIDQPAKKVFVKELIGTKLSSDPCMVWIQGLIVQTTDDLDTVFVDDGTGVARVKDCKKLAFTPEIPDKGSYVMFIGRQTSSDECPAVKAIKIQKIHPHVVMETMWPLEVIDQNLRLNR